MTEKIVIFDLDGVIINSHELQMRSLEYAYRTVIGSGIVPYDEFFYYSGDSLENIFLKLKLPLEMISEYRRYSLSHSDEIEAHRGIESSLRNIRKQRCKIALCTGKERKRTITILENLGLKQYFDLIICSDDVMYPKPHPESVNYIISCLSGCIENTIFIGDGKNDIKCASAAGISSIAVSWGDTPLNDLLEENPTYVIEDIEELSEFLITWIK